MESSCTQSCEMVFLMRRAVSRAAPLAYQHSRMMRPITRSACKVLWGQGRTLGHHTQLSATAAQQPCHSLRATLTALWLAEQLCLHPERFPKELLLPHSFATGLEYLVGASAHKPPFSYLLSRDQKARRRSKAAGTPQ